MNQNKKKENEKGHSLFECLTLVRKSLPSPPIQMCVQLKRKKGERQIEWLRKSHAHRTRNDRTRKCSMKKQKKKLPFTFFCR